MFTYLYGETQKNVDLDESLSYANNLFNNFFPCIVDKKKMMMCCARISFEYFYGGKECMYKNILTSHSRPLTCHYFVDNPMLFKYASKGIQYCNDTSDYYPLFHCFLILSSNDKNTIATYKNKLKEYDDSKIVGEYLNICGETFEKNENFKYAIECYYESFLNYDIDFSRDIEKPLWNLANLCEILGDYKDAAIYYMRFFNEFNDPMALLYSIFCNIVYTDANAIDNMKIDTNFLNESMLLNQVVYAIKNGNTDVIDGVMDYLGERTSLHEIKKMITIKFPN